MLSRIDGTTDLDQLGQVTGLSPEEVRVILDRLAREGAIEPPEASSATPNPPGGPRVLENPRTGITHARLIASNHRNPTSAST